MDDFDPLKLSRDLERAEKLARRWERTLREGGGEDDDPFATVRHVSTRRTFLQVSELPPDDPLREPLRRWVHRMTERRVNAAARVRVMRERRVEERLVQAPDHGRFTLAVLLAKGLDEAPRRAAWLDSYVNNAAPLSDTTKKLWERRAEVAARLGLATPDAIEGIGPDVLGRAEKWLALTDDLAAEFRSNTLAALVESALGLDALEGWPNRLAVDSLMDWFRDTELFRSLEPDFGRFPPAVGASSYLRALRRIGASWADAAAPEHQPFVVAHDPYGLRRRKYAVLFGALPASVAFAERRLGLSREKARDHQRRLSRLRLLESRFGALRVLLRSAALRGGQSLSASFEEACERTFGFGLPVSAAGALFVFEADEAQRFAGRLLAASQAAQLRDEHDEDWFRNPRAVDQLRSEAALSPDPLTTDDALDAGEAALLSDLTEALR